MKNKARSLILTLLFFPVLAFSANVQVFNFQTRSHQTLDELVQRLRPYGSYILGEQHYNEKVQKAQASFINKLVEAHQMENSFTVNWEFLNYTDHNDIQKHYQSYLRGDISASKFLEENGQANALTYLPILEVAKKLNGAFVGVNAPRSIKREIIKNGLGSVDPSYIPPNMSLGSDLYLERFKEAMGGHVGDDQIMGYYTAQCYTDSVMSYYMEEFNQHELSFLVVGSFHSDYGLGTVSALRRLAVENLVTIKFVDKSQLSDTEWDELTTVSPKLGQVADFIISID